MFPIDSNDKFDITLIKFHVDSDIKSSFGDTILTFQQNALE